jgi:hypothetical protein
MRRGRRGTGGRARRSAGKRSRAGVQEKSMQWYRRKGVQKYRREARTRTGGRAWSIGEGALEYRTEACRSKEGGRA